MTPLLSLINCQKDSLNPRKQFTLLTTFLVYYKGYTPEEAAGRIHKVIIEMILELQILSSLV